MCFSGALSGTNPDTLYWGILRLSAQRELGGGGVKMGNLWNKKAQINSVDNIRGLITTKQTKPRPVASAAPHPITRGVEDRGFWEFHLFWAWVNSNKPAWIGSRVGINGTDGDMGSSIGGDSDGGWSHEFIITQCPKTIDILSSLTEQAHVRMVWRASSLLQGFWRTRGFGCSVIVVPGLGRSAIWPSGRGIMRKK